MDHGAATVAAEAGGALARSGFNLAAVYRKTRLPCGVRVVTETIASVRSVAAGVWVHVGSRDEPHSKAGVSHFIEHMVFKGTVRRRMHQIARRLESVGGYLNAFTGKEYTCFYARALDAHVGRAIDTITDLVLHPVFPEKELGKEKAVVLEEMKMYEDAPEEVVFDRFERAVYPEHSLGIPIVGFPGTVASLSRQDLLDYVGQHYRPERMILSVAGNVSHERVVRLASRAFRQQEGQAAHWSRTPVGAYRPRILQEEKPIQQAHLILGRRGLGVQDPLRTSATILNTVLGGGMSSRLNQNIREKYGYCYHVSSFANMHSDTGDLGVYLGTDPSRVPHATKLVFRELDRLAQKPVGLRTLNQAKSQVKGHIMLGLESMSNRMMRLARQELLLGGYITLDEVLEEVDGIEAGAVQDAAQTLFKEDTFSTVVLVPPCGKA